MNRHSKLKLSGQTLLNVSACAGLPLEKSALSGAAKSVLGYDASPKQVDLALEALIQDNWFERSDHLLQLPKDLSGILARKTVLDGKAIESFNGLDRFIPPVRLTWSTDIGERELRGAHYACRKALLRGGKHFIEATHQFGSFLERYGNLWLGDLIYGAEEDFEQLMGQPLMAVALSYGLSEGGPEPSVISSVIAELCERCDDDTLLLIYPNIQHVLRSFGHFELMEHLLARLPMTEEIVAKDQALVHLINNRFDDAIACFEQGLLLKDHTQHPITSVYEDTWGQLYAYTLLIRQRDGDLDKMEQALSLSDKHAVLGTFRALRALLQFAKGDKEGAKASLTHHRYKDHPHHVLGVLLQAYAELIVLGHCKPSLSQLEESKFLDRHRRSHGWWVREVETLMTHKKRGLQKRKQEPSFLKPYPTGKIKWDQALERMEASLGLGITDPESPRPLGASRLAWMIKFDDNERLSSIRPVEQRLKDTVWTTSKDLKLSDLGQRQLPPMAIEQDDLACRTIHFQKESSEYWGNMGDYHVALEEVLPILVEHPHLFDEKTGHALSLKRERIKLIVQRDDNGITLTTQPKCTELQSYLLEKINDNTWNYMFISGDQRSLIQDLPLGSKLPLSTQKRMKVILKKLSQFFDIVECSPSDTTGD